MTLTGDASEVDGLLQRAEDGALVVGGCRRRPGVVEAQVEVGSPRLLPHRYQVVVELHDPFVHMLGHPRRHPAPSRGLHPVRRQLEYR